jgi:hypothetical protein
LRQVNCPALDPLAFLIHLLSFAAPALVVAFLVTCAARLILPAGATLRWWPSFAINALAGLAILGAGLWFYGRDGKMMTYAALVVGVASCQWLIGRAWRA